jgi:chromosome segregation ATPase
VEALKRHIAAEERMQAATDRERTALELADQVRKALAAVEAHEASVAALVAAAAKKEERLAAREAEEMARLQELQKREEAVEAELAAGTRRLQAREEAVEEELAAGTRRLQEREAALRAREAKVEEILAERSASVGRIARWVGVVNPLLEALGANPIRVSEAPSPLGTALQVLDSTAARLRDVEAGIQDLLETEGQEVARGTAEYILTSFRSHDPAIQLTPVLVGPLRTTAAAAREGVLEVVDMVAARLRRRPEPAESGSTSGAPEQ